ncbi:MAG: hypothetical protein MRY21_05825 [Simkaniaceae bacterium]|nr:hypothetical protein [Simkaniaceae bacterium]
MEINPFRAEPEIQFTEECLKTCGKAAALASGISLIFAIALPCILHLSGLLPNHDL